MDKATLMFRKSLEDFEFGFIKKISEFFCRTQQRKKRKKKIIIFVRLCIVLYRFKFFLFFFVSLPSVIIIFQFDFRLMNLKRLMGIPP